MVKFIPFAIQKHEWKQCIVSSIGGSISPFWNRNFQCAQIHRYTPMYPDIVITTSAAHCHLQVHHIRSFAQRVPSIFQHQMICTTNKSTDVDWLSHAWQGAFNEHSYLCVWFLTLCSSIPNSEAPHSSSYSYLFLSVLVLYLVLVETFILATLFHAEWVLIGDISVA